MICKCYLCKKDYEEEDEESCLLAGLGAVMICYDCINFYGEEKLQK